MMKLPPLNVNRAPAGQCRRLARWLAEWEIDCALAGAAELRDDRTDSSGARSNTRPAKPRHSVSDRKPGPGQIRLFRPGPAPTRKRLLYVALLESGGDGLLTAPYGRFAEPCLPGELLTGRETPCLRVLCVWNATPLPVSLLREASWFVDPLTPAELADAKAVRRHDRADGPLPAALERRVGPPLWHPCDPRRRYIEGERVLVRALHRLAQQPGGTLAYPLKPEAWPKAAEPREPYAPDGDNC